MKRPLMLFFAALVIFYSKVAQSAFIDTHRVATPYLYGEQEIRVLLPDKYDESKRYRVLYVLPVEAGFGRNSGNAIGELQEMNAHNLYDLILVQMGFEKEPWFGDHISDPRTRQASYLKEFLVPFIESKYSTLEAPEGRLLFGFSKSGWGAFSLIMTYPEFFGYAAAWDAPLLLNDFHYGMREVYGDTKQLARYRPDLLIPQRSAFFQQETRLVLTGEQAWGNAIPAPGGSGHTLEAHKMLENHNIKHFFDRTIWAPHRWHKVWMYPTLSALMRITILNEISHQKNLRTTSANASPGAGQVRTGQCTPPKSCPLNVRTFQDLRESHDVAATCCLGRGLR
jgi:hypothetical protein